jgi:pSer/pThr/pTyr-binding forkhead associated (FHA) protein
VPLCRIFNREGEEIRRFDTDDPRLETPISVGRSSSCSVVLKHEAGRTVGRTHFELDQEGAAWYIINHSRTGLAKGDKKFERAQINLGDVIRFGSCFLAFGEQAGPSPFELLWEPLDGGEVRAVLWPGRNSIGASSDNTISIKEDGVSRQHARITANAADLYVEDLNSATGTFVDNKRIKALTTAQPGTAVRFGKVRGRIVRTDAMLGLDDFEAESKNKTMIVSLIVAVLVLVVLVMAVKFLFFSGGKLL